MQPISLIDIDNASTEDSSFAYQPFTDISVEDVNDYESFDRKNDEDVTERYKTVHLRQNKWKKSSDLARHEGFNTIVERDNSDSMEESTDEGGEGINPDALSR